MNLSTATVQGPKCNKSPADIGTALLRVDSMSLREFSDDGWDPTHSNCTFGCSSRNDCDAADAMIIRCCDALQYRSWFRSVDTVSAQSQHSLSIIAENCHYSGYDERVASSLVRDRTELNSMLAAASTCICEKPTVRPSRPPSLVAAAVGTSSRSHACVAASAVSAVSVCSRQSNLSTRA